MFTVFSWYLAMQLIALAAWPLAFAVCHRLPDRGYGLSKGLGLLLVTYITWALAHAASKFPALGFSFGSVSAAWAGVLAISLICIWRRGPEMWQFIRKRLGYIISLELVMLGGLIFMTSLRAAVPHISYHVASPMPDSIIDHAAEKFMDFAILNSLLTSSQFPPHDAWVSGHHLNYYYFGHMLWATLIKFSSVVPEVGYNLAMAAAFALTSALAFSIGYNLTSRKTYAWLALFLIVISSNLDGFWQLLNTIKLGLFPGNDFAALLGRSRSWWEYYDFWRSSRIIAGTINEFPAFSFLLGDLHAHLSGLFLNLVGWSIAIQIFRSARQYRSIWRYEVNSFDELFLAALIIGALSATNSWDVPIYAGILALALWSGSTGQRDPYAWTPPWQRTTARLLSATEAIIVTVIVTLFGAGLLFSPFLLNFNPPKAPEGALVKMVAPENRTSPFEFFTHWAPLLVFTAVAVLMALRSRHNPVQPDAGARPSNIRTVAIMLCVLAAAVVLRPVWQGWIAVTAAAATILLSITLASRHLPPASRFLCGLLLLFSVVVWFCEIFYIDDVFEGPIERINTVFKAYYGLWPMMAVATIISLRLLTHTGIRRSRRLDRKTRAALMITPLIIVGLPYIILGAIHRINSTSRLGHWDTPDVDPPADFFKPEARANSLDEALDGLRYFAFTHPDDYQAIMWIRAHTDPNATLLEAAGTQYTYSGRISTMTGRSALAGWIYHSWGWRGREFSDERLERIQYTSDIYTEANPARAAEMLRNADIAYIIVGPQEREQYPELNELKFRSIADLVFSQGQTHIYKLKPVTRQTQENP